MRSRLALATAIAFSAALVSASSAVAAKGMQVGLYDEPEALGNPAKAFPLMKTLRTQVLRVNLYLGLGAGAPRLRPRRRAQPTHERDQS